MSSDIGVLKLAIIFGLVLCLLFWELMSVRRALHRDSDNRAGPGAPSASDDAKSGSDQPVSQALSKTASHAADTT